MELAAVDACAAGFEGDGWEMAAWRQRKSLPGKASGRDLSSVYVASAVRRNADPDMSAASRLRQGEPRDFPVTGGALRGRGMAPGEALGATLERLEAAWVDSGFSLGRDELLGRLDRG